jgi:hypothetical protein
MGSNEEYKRDLESVTKKYGLNSRQYKVKYSSGLIDFEFYGEFKGHRIVGQIHAGSFKWHGWNGYSIKVEHNGHVQGKISIIEFNLWGWLNYPAYLVDELFGLCYILKTNDSSFSKKYLLVGSKPTDVHLFMNPLTQKAIEKISKGVSSKDLTINKKEIELSSNFPPKKEELEHLLSALVDLAISIKSTKSL